MFLFHKSVKQKTRPKTIDQYCILYISPWKFKGIWKSYTESATRLSTYWTLYVLDSLCTGLSMHWTLYVPDYPHTDFPRTGLTINCTLYVLYSLCTGLSMYRTLHILYSVLDSPCYWTLYVLDSLCTGLSVNWTLCVLDSLCTGLCIKLSMY